MQFRFPIGTRKREREKGQICSQNSTYIRKSRDTVEIIVEQDYQTRIISVPEHYVLSRWNARWLLLSSSSPSSSPSYRTMSCILSSVPVFLRCPTFAPTFWKPGSVRFPIFCDFCWPTIVHLVYVISSCSSPDSDSFYDSLDLADVADVFVMNSIPQCCQWYTLRSSFSLILVDVWRFCFRSCFDGLLLF